ncbi:MAG TPA: sugar phosphate isomerase/epimerase family protein [Planctomycetota bacterium]|jgi:hexulose-6-phosphate isomerase|nr:sugar phosphate isomerase/epimerase family protein [Planctomycetota bacterium]
MKSLDRRSFLLATAGGLTALSAVAPAPTRVSDGKPFKKAVKIGMVREGNSLREKFQLLKDLGYDAVEMDSPNNLTLEEVLEAKETSGLPIHGVVDSVHWGKPLSHPDPTVRAEGLAGLITALKDAKAYGATSVLLVPAVVNKDISYGDAYRRSQEMIRKALPLATELNIQIAFENVWNNFLLSPVEMARYIDEFDSPLVGCYFDVGNIVRYGWPTHWVEELKHRVFKLDMKGYSRKLQNEQGPWAGFKVELDEGDCDWSDVRARLLTQGFNSYATAEVSGGDRARLADILARMNRVLPNP